MPNVNVGAHPAFLESERKFDAINKFICLYGDLSGGVHGRTMKDLEMRIALKKIKYSPVAATKDVDLIEQCVAAANFLLASFHREKMSHFQVEDRRIILLTMPPRARRAWQESLTEGQ